MTLLSITDFFEKMSGFEQIFWYLAIPSSIVFLIMTVSAFIGLDGADEFEGDIDIEDLESDGDSGNSITQFFTFRNFVNFFTAFSWIGIACLDSGLSRGVSTLWATAAGLTVVSVMYFVFSFLKKLQANNILVMENSIGKTGSVYLTIPEKGKGVGKVNVEIQGAVRNVDASSDGPELKTGTKIKVVDVQDGELIVGQN